MEPEKSSKHLKDDANSKRRENVGGQYDLLLTDLLTSPSTTVQWYSTKVYKKGNRSKKLSYKFPSKFNLILGTQNRNGDNHVIIANLLLKRGCVISKFHKNPLQPLGPGAHAFPHILKIEAKIKHEGSVNCARYMPQIPSILAAKTPGGDVHIYKLENHISLPLPETQCNPYLRLKGLSGEGYGLSWNPYIEGHLLSCSNGEHSLCHWDINANGSKQQNIGNFNKFYQERAVVKDCAWHSIHGLLFGAVAGKDLHIWDIRANFTNTPVLTGVGHEALINCLSFNCFSENVVATGSSDKTVAIWDRRQMKTPQNRLYWHKDETFKVQWSPNIQSILATSGTDKKLLIWDIDKIGAAKPSLTAKDAPPELLFIHRVHSAQITDFSWNAKKPWLISSVSLDGVINIWKMDEYVDDN